MRASPVDSTIPSLTPIADINPLWEVPVARTSILPTLPASGLPPPTTT